MTTPAPIVFVDTMLGFRLTAGTIVVSLALIRSVWDEGQTRNFIQPAVDIAMPIPVLRDLIATLGSELDRAEARASLTPHPGVQ